MRLKLMSKILVGLAAACALATQASADCHKKSALKATGVLADASGEVDLRASGNLQRFKLAMDAKVPDGTTFVIYVNGLAAGTVTFLLNAGEGEFNNSNDGLMPNGAESVCAVTSVELRGADNLPVAVGAF